MKVVINIVLSLGMLGLCLWLVWPSATTRDELALAFEALSWGTLGPALAMCIGIMGILHFARALRWNYLLGPLGVNIPPGPMLAIQSVGFMAILALPARLGEFVRPGLMRKHGISASSALGLVAVERIIDGLLVSLLVFGAFFSLRGPQAPGWMMPTAFAALGVFSVALCFLLFALKWPEQSVRFMLRLSLLPRFAPRIARVIEVKVLDMIRGFTAVKDLRSLGMFLVWSLVYWTCNGLTVFVLARAFNLELTLVGAFATMGLLSVGVMLPNSPGLVGQYQWFMLLGLSLYLGADASHEGTALYIKAFAFANVHYLMQVSWYVLAGAIGLATRYVSFHDVWLARKASA
jgi:glycosyltransferase 2 family protein